MITLFVLFFILPHLFSFTGERREIKKEQERQERVLRDAAKYGKRWG